MGDTFTNYYMVFGGTNLDDWAGGKNITSYDYDAPIREDGSVGPRYQRVQALGEMIRDHGVRLARADAVEITGSASDNDVELAERRAPDGSRYIFVRTQNNTAPRAGTATVKEPDGTNLAFDYSLEPFGAKVLYLPPGVTDAKQGEWLPKPAPEIQHPTDVPSPVVISQAVQAADPMPVKWERLAPGARVESLGLYGSHFFYYKIKAQPGATVTLQIPRGDEIVASANGKLLKGTADNPPAPAKGTVDKKGIHVAFTLPPDANELVALYENLGHANSHLAMGQPFGILGVQGADAGAPLEVAKGTLFDTEEACGDALTSPSNSDPTVPNSKPVSIGNDAPAAPDALLTWYLAGFELPDKPQGIAAPWHLHIEANGNGFIYVNGHCIGRYREVGPQNDFYLPDCWLNFGQGQSNKLALDLRPVDKGVSVLALSVAPDTTFGVATPLAAK
jgi:hypothetical protein